MSRFQKTRGFTFIEILVAVVVAAILIGAIYQVMVNQNRAYIIEGEKIDIQQNARAALDFVARELRLAGFGVSDDDDPETNVFGDLLNNAPTDTGMTDPGTDAVIFAASVGYGSWVAEGVYPGAETHSVKVYSATEKCFEFTEGTVSSPTLVDLIAYTGTRKRRLNEEPLKITKVTGPTEKDPLTTITFDQLIADVLVDEAKGKGLIKGDQVVLFPKTIRYSVHEGVLKRSLSNDGGDTWPIVQPLINSVEDLQLCYSFDGIDDDHKPDVALPIDKTDSLPCVIRAVDADSEGVLDTKMRCCGRTELFCSVAYRSNSTVANVHHDTGDPSRNPLRGVKLTLVVRSSRQNPDHRFQRLFKPLSIQDHYPKTDAKDGYLRRVFEREIPFRNLGLNPAQ